MSYDIHLEKNGSMVIFDNPHDLAGGTQAVGGTREAWLSITYNYAKHFSKVLGEHGIRSLYGKTGAEAIPVLEKAIKDLGGVYRDKDYWAPTQGNAAGALKDLQTLCEMAPEAIISGD